MPLNPHEWSVTAADNDVADSSINWQEGQVPGSVNASARGMMAAFKRLLADSNGTKSTAGSSNAYTLAAPNIDYAALLDGLTIGIRASFTNTGAATFNLKSIGAKKILTPDAIGDIAAGQIQSGGHYKLEYDSSADSANGAFILLNPSVRSGTIEEFAGTTLPTGYLWCDGATFSAATYPGLNAAIGTTYGAGPKVPDKRGRVGVGRDDMGGNTAGRITNAGCGIVGTTLGASGGAQNHTLVSGELPTITPAGSVSTPSGTISQTTGTVSVPTGVVTVTGSVGGTGAAVTVDIADPNHTHGISPTALQDSTADSTIGSNGMIGAAGASATQAAATGITATVASAAVAAQLTWTSTGATFTGAGQTFTGGTTTFTGNAATFTGTAFGSDDAHNNVQPMIVTNFIIKV